MSTAHYPPLAPHPHTAPNNTSGAATGYYVNSNIGQNDPDNLRQVRKLCAGARKVIGLTPIEPRMIEMQIKSYGAKDTAEAMLMEVQSYLKCEMKMYPSEISKLDIVKIFPPPGHDDDWKTLYVEFDNEYQVDKVFQHTKYMIKRDHRVLHWFPQEMKERRHAIEKIAYDIREAGRANMNRIGTRLKVGKDDIELSTKLPTGKWKRELLPPDLPAIDLQYNPSPVGVTSPPPGRPGLEEVAISKKRQISSDDDADDISKKPRAASKDAMVEDMADEEAIQNKAKGGEKPAVSSLGPMDRGKFTSQEAYSPLTPAKQKGIPDLSVLVHSPVFHSKSAKK